jgi:SanA protein
VVDLDVPARWIDPLRSEGCGAESIGASRNYFAIAPGRHDPPQAPRIARIAAHACVGRRFDARAAIPSSGITCVAIPRMRNLRSLLKWLLLSGLAAAVFVTGANVWVFVIGNQGVVKDVSALPTNDAAVLLGTSPLLHGKWKNPFFESRMDAATQIFNEGKVRHILVSGDNGRREYDEPTAMRDALIARGVPANAITLDYAGFRTLDSIERARAVFGLERATIVTDDFHLARALFLAQSKGLHAVGYCGAPVPWKWSTKTRVREVGSRVKAWLDVYVLGTKPHFYGPREEIRLSATL